MSEHFFTFAELDFLLSSDPAWTDHRETMPLPEEESEAVRLAGMASLLARGLARMDGSDVVVAQELAGLLTMLRSCTDKVSLAAMTGDERFSTSTLAFSPDRELRMLNSTVAPGVVELRPLRADVDPAEMLAGIAMSAIQEADGVIAIAQNGTVLQVQHHDGEWAWGLGEDRPSTTASEAEIREQVQTLFGPALATS